MPHLSACTACACRGPLLIRLPVRPVYEMKPVKRAHDSPHTFGWRCSFSSLAPSPLSAPSSTPVSPPRSSLQLRQRCCSSCCCQLKLSSRATEAIPNTSHPIQHKHSESSDLIHAQPSPSPSPSHNITLGTYVSTCPCLMLVICAIFKLMISDKRSFTRLMMDSYHQQICHWWMDFCPSSSRTPCLSAPRSDRLLTGSLSLSLSRWPCHSRSSLRCAVKR